MNLADFKKEKIVAMKEKNQDAITALNVIINKIMLLTIEKKGRNEGEVTEAEVVSILQKTEKEIAEEMEAFKKANREDTVLALSKQIEVVKKYLPSLMTKDEIKAIVDSLEDKSLGSIMKHFKANYGGKCDMRDVNAVAKEYQN